MPWSSGSGTVGVEVREGDDPSGRPQVYVDDPFGNRIELVG